MVVICISHHGTHVLSKYAIVMQPKEANTKVFGSISSILSFSPSKQDIQLLENIFPNVEYLLMKSFELRSSTRFEECVETLQAAIDITWEQLNTSHWSLVPDSQRAIFSAASLLKVVALVHQALQSPEDSTLSYLEKAVETADLGLLLGNSHQGKLSKAAHLLSQAINCYKPISSVSKSTSTSEPSKLQVLTDSVRVLQCPSLETFSSDHFYPRLPVKLLGCMSHWPALRLWTNLDYLLELCGSRTVPVELGRSYSDSDWSQQLMPLGQFISQHIQHSTPTAPIGYLAQHQLFNQVPELRKDIAVPDYCSCSEEEGEVDINAWFGPAGTVSPLHHDPKHNLLCQVVGTKRITLYSPSVSDHLYPHEGRFLSNTAQVDPEAPDYKQFPKYRGTQGFHCHLSPGEMLYIPPGWWHHVRALDVSFSVSFWWT